MARLTITLSDARYAALKLAAAQRQRTMGELIDDSLERCGIRTADEAVALVHRARENARLSEDDAVHLAVEQVARYRTRRDGA